MYKKQLTFICLLLGIICAGVGIGIYRTTHADYTTYAHLLESSNPPSSHEKTAQLRQSREGVHKKVWIQGTSPLFTSIECASSDLFIFKEDREIEVIEELHHVTCVSQEKLYYEGDKPMQLVRHIQAEKGVYNYSKEAFSGENVTLTTYHLPGHTLTLPFETSLSSEMTLSAHEAFFDGKDLTLIGDVQLIKPGKQYALADHLDYSPKTQKMFLEAYQGRVLFFDQIHNMQLSASQVRAERNPETQKDLVQGIGDVRFIFGPEEFEKIKERFHSDGHFRS